MTPEKKKKTEEIQSFELDLRRGSLFGAFLHVAAVERIDALFAIERGINGLPPDQRVTARQERSRPLVVALETWL